MLIPEIGEGGTHVSHVTEQFVATSSGTDDSLVVEAFALGTHDTGVVESRNQSWTKSIRRTEVEWLLGIVRQKLMPSTVATEIQYQLPWTIDQPKQTQEVKPLHVRAILRAAACWNASQPPMKNTCPRIAC